VGQYNTIDQPPKEELFTQSDKIVDKTQPIYKLNIKNVNKGALKIKPEKLSNRKAEGQVDNQVIITPKQMPVNIKKARYVVNQGQQQVQQPMKFKISDKKQQNAIQ
jgi:hypothetical protein